MLNDATAEHLLELGLRLRVLAMAVEGLGRRKGREPDGVAISAMLYQISDEIADMGDVVDPPNSASGPARSTWS
jgi:hypothetical protein